ncbi:uncharacterized protein LOC121991282 [Zingiber officinale]|uniref:uncharacterized protein LOC121991282 n=1 Tax=Zingiber officinale TaxID=94328 RepID=UPI001C4AB303|nr:uncharacterized protein LOC121991282 [Zingiber officinale]
MATAQRKFLLVTVDYFSKWVEAKLLAKITYLHLCGLPPKAKGQAEVINREILRGLQAQLDHTRGSWIDELPNVLWALRKTLKETIGVTQFHLVYDGEAVVPMEVKVESDLVHLYDEGNTKWRHMELDLMDEAWGKAPIRLMAYLQRIKQSYNQRVILRSFQVGDLVWKRSKPVGDVNKLEAPWVGPYNVVQKLRSRPTTWRTKTEDSLSGRGARIISNPIGLDERCASEH